MNNRRSFIKSAAALSAGLGITGLQPLFSEGIISDEGFEAKRKIHVFGKHLQWLSYEEMAKTASSIGFNGVDLTVRPGGQVLPENVKKDLPKAVEALRSAGLLADRMTTAILDADDPLTRDILKTASELGIRNYRMGWFAYDPALSIKLNLESFNTKLKKLAALNRKFNIRGAYQNHAGEMAGGPVWDMGLMLEDVDPEYLGIRYDIRHATVEGGLSWPLGLKYLSERINSFDIKDFIWKKIDAKWQPYNVPLGDGLVDFNRYIRLVKELGIKGDFTVHLEYPIGGAEHGASKLDCSPDKVISAMKHDLSVLRNMI